MIAIRIIEAERTICHAMACDKVNQKIVAISLLCNALKGRDDISIKRPRPCRPRRGYGRRDPESAIDLIEYNLLQRIEACVASLEEILDSQDDIIPVNSLRNV